MRNFVILVNYYIIEKAMPSSDVASYSPLRGDEGLFGGVLFTWVLVPHTTTPSTS